MEENKEITIEIPEAVVNFIQRLDIECQSYKNIISYILTHEDMNITTERFKQYQEDYQNTLYAFEIAKQELEQQYIDISLNNIPWHLNYKTNKITINYKDGDKLK